METKIIDNKPIYTRILNNSNKMIHTKAEVIDASVIQTKIINPYNNITNSFVEVRPNTKLSITSYITNNPKTIFLGAIINNGSWNTIYKISSKKTTKLDSKLVIRISNESRTVESVNAELKGIKIQYKLCTKSSFIGNVIDYGMIQNSIKPLREYSIVERYGLSLNKLLDNNVKYANMSIILKFMKNLLQTVNTIHKNNYAHLDLKPDNILFKNIMSMPKQPVNELNFAIFDFGGSAKFTKDKSKELSGQQASPAFSPPEVKELQFGKKSDIWAYGIICYLICIRKTFIKAKASKIFLNKNDELIPKNIKKNLKNIFTKIIPKYIKEDQIDNYMGVLKPNNFYLLSDFFQSIFIVDSNDRPTSEKLLKHDIFKLLN